MAAEIDRAYAPYEMIKTDPPTIFSTELWARFAALAEFSKPNIGRQAHGCSHSAASTGKSD